MTLVERIKQLCRNKGIDLGILENELGFGKKSVYKWDKNTPSLERVIKVADYFDVSLDFLTERHIYKNDFKEEPNGEYTLLSQKAKEKGIPLEVLAQLIDLYAK